MYRYSIHECTTDVINLSLNIKSNEIQDSLMIEKKAGDLSLEVNGMQEYMNISLIFKSRLVKK